VSPQVLRAEEAAVAPKVLARKPLPFHHNLATVVVVVVVVVRVGNGDGGAECSGGSRCSGGGSGGGGRAILAWLWFVGLW